ncbi:hypothetical protein [Legionella cardiaca]|uniref:Dot/Icm T4SS effector n=1 Tax=Legionella cardiaca TaxID=1071983 RepID=A0ABY8AMP0_9GAMM|nr:hypothetical protein [Legionella cardiaca]WED41959.1 hypothetical protein PXX05_08420 [Legionella cardiaca]
MPTKSKFLIVTNEPDINYYHGDFSRVESNEVISGLFAYIAYVSDEDRIYVLSPLKNFKSCHSGIALIFNQLIKRQTSFVVSTQERIKKFSNQEPHYGGEVLIERGVIIFWNFKSGVYSSKIFNYNDSNPDLEREISCSLFPSNLFMSIKDSETFERDFLNQNFFEPEGKVKANQQVNNLLKIKNFIGEVLNTRLKNSSLSKTVSEEKIVYSEESPYFFKRNESSTDKLFEKEKSISAEPPSL